MGIEVLPMNVYEKIKQAIVTGLYKPGHRLTEESLTKDWEVSRTPIREALKQLEFDGLITPLKRGFSVRVFSKEDVRQVYDLRAMLESYAAGQASIHRTNGHLEKMKQANDSYEMALEKQGQEHVERIDAIVKANHVFHDAVFEASRNDHVRELISKVVVLPLIFRSFYWFDEKNLFYSLQNHHTILRAVESGDVERAKAAMTEHIFRGRDYVLHYYEGGGTDD